ncbi:MAG: hypothetical protein R2822_10560 [Spirosomataceae bacterium]
MSDLVSLCLLTPCSSFKPPSSFILTVGGKVVKHNFPNHLRTKSVFFLSTQIAYYESIYGRIHPSDDLPEDFIAKVPRQRLKINQLMEAGKITAYSLFSTVLSCGVLSRLRMNLM